MVFNVTHNIMCNMQRQPLRTHKRTGIIIGIHTSKITMYVLFSSIEVITDRKTGKKGDWNKCNKERK